MQFKILEIRDEGTHIPVIAMRMLAESEVQNYYIHDRCGHPRDGHGIVVMHLDNMKATNDPYEWPALGMGRRTMGNAHDYIIKHFDDLKDGDVVDVRVILGEAKEPVPSDRYWDHATRKHNVPATENA